MQKIILLLWCTFSFGQATNQMVSFTQAQSLGFTLKSGQSHVTSGKCMTKAEIIAKYNVAITGYSDNQLVPRSAWVSSGYNELMTVGKPTTINYGFRVAPDGWGYLTNNTLPVSILNNGKVFALYYSVSSSLLVFAISLSETTAPISWNSISINGYVFYRSSFSSPRFNDAMWIFELSTAANPFGTTVGAQIPIIIL